MEKPVVGKKNKNRSKSAMTLLEMVIALAIMVIIIAVFAPQLKTINDSWASKQANAEVLQNARVFVDQINRSLSSADRVTDVSDPCETNGYIEFEDNTGTACRMDIAANNYIEFGPVGSLSDLAGPVSQFKITCYDDDDLDTPLDISASGVEGIRFVKAEVIFPNPGPGQDRTFTTSTYLRTNAGLGSETIDPGDFGDDSTTGTNLISMQNWQIASKVVLSCDASITSISAYINVPPPKNLRYAIYTDSAGEPGVLVVQTDIDIAGLSGFRWKTIDIVPTEISAGTYWVAMAVEKQNIGIKQSAFGLGELRIKTGTDATTSGFDPLWGVSESSDLRSVSIYAVGNCLISP